MRLLPPRWPLAEQVRQRAELLDRVIDALGVDPADMVRKDVGKAFADARVMCLHCRHAEACQMWLATSDGPSLPPDFCLNADLFRQLLLSRMEKQDA